MKKWMICGVGLIALVFWGCFSVKVLAISEEQKAAIVNRCETIRDDLKNVQRMDARTRVFLGSHYETILSKFVTSLNLRLVENNLSDARLIDNQVSLATAKSVFSADFISYQQELEGLVVMDCREEPGKFYEKLKLVREKRKAMVADVVKMRELIAKDIELTKKLLEELK